MKKLIATFLALAALAGAQTIPSGTGFFMTSIAPDGGGTVTSIAISGSNGIGVSGSPITGSGTITLSLGAITPTTVNGLTITSSSGTLSITNAKTFAVSNSITLAGTDSTVMTFPTTSATIARTDAANTFTGVQTFSAQPVSTAGGYTSTVTGTGGTSYGGIGPIIVYAKSATILTAGSPADLASIVIPSGITRYTVGTNNGNTVVGFKALAETASGTLAAGAVDIYTGAGGTGSALAAATWNLPSAASSMTGTTTGSNLVLTAGTLYVRQTVNSANAGTCSFYLVIWPIP